MPTNRNYRKKPRKRSPPEEPDEEEGLSTVVEYTTATESESEVEARVAHRRSGWCAWCRCCSRHRRQQYYEFVRDMTVCALILYWVLDQEAQKRKWWWYAEGDSQNGVV